MYIIIGSKYPNRCLKCSELIRNKDASYRHKKKCIKLYVSINDEIDSLHNSVRLERFEQACIDGEKNKLFKDHIDTIDNDYVKLEMLKWIEETFKTHVSI
jgi:hypothetical protein